MKVNVERNKEKWLSVENGKGEYESNETMGKMTKYKMRK
jgi:hypothetical protein